MDPDLDEIYAARDRVRAVLRPWLGPVGSLDRANNIAQAMLVGSADPQAVAEELLRSTGLAEVKRLSRVVARAWQGHGPERRSRAERDRDRDTPTRVSSGGL